MERCMNFDAAWRAFEQHDARIEAPAQLERRVFHALRMVGDDKPPRRLGHVMPGLMAAVAMLVVAVWARQPSDPPESRKLLARPLASDTALAELKPGVTRDQPVVATVEPRPSPMVHDRTMVTMMLEFPEALQVVRIRVPREAIETLGLVLLEPDAQGTVDVDVIVGEDGLPRDVRQVRTVQE
jgi:hypothetical protein